VHEQWTPLHVSHDFHFNFLSHVRKVLVGNSGRTGASLRRNVVLSRQLYTHNQRCRCLVLHFTTPTCMASGSERANFANCSFFSRFDTIHERDGHQTDTTRRHRPRLSIASRGKNSERSCCRAWGCNRWSYYRLLLQLKHSSAQNWD